MPGPWSSSWEPCSPEDSRFSPRLAVPAQLIYFPFDGGVPQAVSGSRGENATLGTADGLRLAAWFVPPPRATPAPRCSCFRNAGTAARGRVAQALARRGFSVLLVDYRGYGGNPGSRASAGCTRCAGAHDFALARTTSIRGA